MLDLDFSIIIPNLPLLAKGMLVTLKITVTAIVVGIFWGTLLAVARISPIKPLSFLSQLYVNCFRSIPLVMVLMWFYLIVPQAFVFVPNYFAGLTTDGTLANKFFTWFAYKASHSDIRLVSAVIAFSLFEAAYYSEIIRAGISSVSRGQTYASLALGMTRGQSLRLVVLPQAFRVMTPLLLTQGVILFQDTALVYIMGLMDFFRTASNIGKNMGDEVTMVIFAGMVYFVICFAASLVVAAVKKRKI